jgi:hypothetical protein
MTESARLASPCLGMFLRLRLIAFFGATYRSWFYLTTWMHFQLQSIVDPFVFV